jgi:hypothetical protein
MAVGVDYSLFYVKREREERRRGHGDDALIRAVALVLTVGPVEKNIASIFTKLQLPQSGADHRRVLAYLQQD